MPDASERFNTIANHFATSEVHKYSPTMALLHQLLIATESSLKEICDIACGSGHMGLSFEKYVTRLVGVDPAPAMLEEFQKQAKAKGIKVELIRAFAENIPLESNQFDVAVSRLAPHHFSDVQKAINEMARIVKPHGYIAVIDLQGEEDPEVDAFNHQLEVLHDPTHVRSYQTCQWRKFFHHAGLKVIAQYCNRRESLDGVTVKRWCEIADSGPQAELRIRQTLRHASPEVLNTLMIEQHSGEYYMPVKTVLTVGAKTVC